MNPIPKTYKKTLWIFSLLILFFFNNKSLKAADKIHIINGIFQRSINVSEIEYLAETGIAKGVLTDLLKFTNQKPDQIALILKQDTRSKTRVASKLLNSKIGEVILKRIAKIIYPSKISDPKVSVPALRAAIINGLVKGNGSLNTINFIKAYPNKIMTINLPALFNVINKVESVNELVKFYSNSPLNGLKQSKPLDLESTTQQSGKN